MNSRIQCWGAFVLVWAAASIPVSAKSKLPPWAAQLAERSSDVEQLDNERWRVLLSDHAVSVREDGLLDVRRRIAARSFDGRRGGPTIGWFPFQDGTKMRSATAWHQTPEGDIARIRRPPVDVKSGGEFLTDEKVRYIPITEARPGSLVFFEFEYTESLPVLNWLNTFIDGYPVRLSRYSVEAPQGWKIHHDWLRTDGYEPKVEGNRLIWELRDMSGIPDGEALGESPEATAPMLAIAVVPPQPLSRVFVAEDWPKVAAWYDGIIEGKHDADPAVDSLSAQLFEGQQDFFGGILAVGRLVRDDVRYLARLVGIGAYQPRPAGQVLHEKLGDCKDKGTLFRSLLAAAGIESYPVLINATRDRTVSPDVASAQAFNHFVVAVPVASQLDVPAMFRPATFDAEGLGRLLIVDTTDDLNSIGSMPANLAGKTGLLVAGERSRLIELPSDDPAAHRRQHTFEAVIRDGGLDVVERVRLFGEPARIWRELWRSGEKEYLDESERLRTRHWNGLDLESFDVEPETNDGEFVETANFRVNRPDDTVQIFPGVLSLLPRVPIRSREQPVIYEYPRLLTYESRIAGFTAAGSVPDEAEQSGPGWSIETHFERDGEMLVARWELRLTRLRFELDEFEELREFWDAVLRSGSSAFSVFAVD